MRRVWSREVRAGPRHSAQSVLLFRGCVGRSLFRKVPSNVSTQEEEGWLILQLVHLT